MDDVVADNNMRYKRFGVISILVAVFVFLAITNNVITNPVKKVADDIKWIYTDEREIYFENTG